MGILQFLNTRGDPQDQHHIVRMRDFFVYSSHLCIAFELLSINLYELIKMNHFRGLSTGLVRVFVEQVSSFLFWSVCPGRRLAAVVCPAVAFTVSQE